MTEPNAKKRDFQPLWDAEKTQPLEKRVTLIRGRITTFATVVFVIGSELLIWALDYNPKQLFPMVVFASIIAGNMAASNWTYPRE